jgi:hypothetical protein
MAAKYEVTHKQTLWGGIQVVTLWYPEPHNCWRVEVWGSDLDGALQNMTVEGAGELGRALVAAAALGVGEEAPK